MSSEISFMAVENGQVAAELAKQFAASATRGVWNEITSIQRDPDEGVWEVEFTTATVMSGDGPPTRHRYHITIDSDGADVIGFEKLANEQVAER